MAANVKKLKRGELLFSEGDASKSMYFIQRGSLRLYKKKGNAPIELGMIHSGEVVGEMGFLDGGQRSASAEAISDTDLVEVTNDKMQEQLKVMPPWLIVLLKSVVNRLRSANTKIRQLETVSTSITYGRDGPTSAFTYLTPYDVMKISMAVLLSAARSTEKASETHIKVKIGTIQKYAGNILGEHMSKIMEMIDVLSQIEIMKVDRQPDGKGSEKVELFVRDIELLEALLSFVNEENLKDHTKKMNITKRGLAVMALIGKHLGDYAPDANGIASVNMAEIVAKAKEQNGGKEPFLADEFNELVKCKICTEPSITDAKTSITKVHAESFRRLYKMQVVLKEVDAVNESKRRAA